jgi:hypothetical protein
VLSCEARPFGYSLRACGGESVEIRMYYPNESGWLADYRTVICIANFADGKRTGRLNS